MTCLPDGLAELKTNLARSCEAGATTWFVMNPDYAVAVWIVFPMKNKSGAYGARTRNLRRDRAAL